MPTGRHPGRAHNSTPVLGPHQGRRVLGPHRARRVLGPHRVRRVSSARYALRAGRAHNAWKVVGLLDAPIHTNMMGGRVFAYLGPWPGGLGAQMESIEGLGFLE